MKIWIENCDLIRVQFSGRIINLVSIKTICNIQSTSTIKTEIRFAFVLRRLKRLKRLQAVLLRVLGLPV